MNTIDSKYQELLQDILDNGVEKDDRTGTGTISVFGRQIRHKMSEGFPLLTTKKMAWNVMVAELLWFLRGDTNIKFLLDYDCHIWDGDAFKHYTQKIEDVIEAYMCGDIMGFEPHMEKWYSDSDKLIPLTKEEFIHNIKTDEEFAEQWGDLGPIYGAQWRNWLKVGDKIDQIENLINDLKTNPDSRRLMVSAWNVGELEYMVLPPCHYGFQVYTRELSLGERQSILEKKGYSGLLNSNAKNYKTGKKILEIIKKTCDDVNIPTRAISLMFNMRSVDFPLGLPFNIASYALLLEIIAKEVNMIPDELIGNLGDCHIYKNQIDGVKEQLTREPYDLPSVNITERNWYQHEAVKEHMGEKTFNEKILSYRPDCFELIGYKSHPTIKMPLSN
jgi:thymidylate synthase